MKLYWIFPALLFLNKPILAERLDDSLSPRQQLDLDLQWKYQNRLEQLDEAQFQAMFGQARNVEIRLNTSAYVGQRARISLLLPVVIRGLEDPSSLRLSWITNGLFNSGSVTPGFAETIFEGVITDEVMIDRFDFTVEIDARFLSKTMRFVPVYDIEIISP
jgi:hypothetical protein